MHCKEYSFTFPYQKNGKIHFSKNFIPTYNILRNILDKENARYRKRMASPHKKNKKNKKSFY